MLRPVDNIEVRAPNRDRPSYAGDGRMWSSAANVGARGGHPGSPRRLIVVSSLWSAVVTVILLQGHHFGSLLNSTEQPTPNSVKLLLAIDSGNSSNSGTAAIASATGGSAAQGRGPSCKAAASANVSSTVACDPKAGNSDAISPKESELQQQRRCVLQQACSQPEGGYLAVCLAVKDQHRDLPEWLDYHRALGVSHFYIMDDHSDPPLDDVLAPYAQDGIITHRRMGDFQAGQQDLLKTTCHLWNPNHKQMIAYNYCLRDYGARHQFMAFIDTDEFLVISDGTPDLPTLLRDYEAYGGLGVNWRMFGSSGRKKHQNSTLLGYTKCYSEKEHENRHIKTIANMALATRVKGPHEAAYALGYYTVNTAKAPIDGPLSSKPEYDRLVLHHYVTKSEEDYREKMARGSAMSNHKGEEFWKAVQKKAVETCMAGAEAWQRLENRKLSAQHRTTEPH